MKITAITPDLQDVAANGKKSAPASGTSFQDILARELTAAKDQAAVVGAAAAATPSTPAALRLEGLALTEETVSILENFSAALGNPSFSAQDLSPFATALEDESAALLNLKKQLPSENPLAALLERVATASYVEAAKLRRGDYHA